MAHDHTCAHRDRYRYHFYILHILAHWHTDTNFIFGIQGLTHVQTLRHAHTCTKTLTHRCRFAETQACLYTYTNTTHTDVHVRNLRNYYFKSTFKVKFTKIITLDRNANESVNSKTLLNQKKQISLL